MPSAEGDDDHPVTGLDRGPQHLPVVTQVAVTIATRSSSAVTVGGSGRNGRACSQTRPSTTRPSGPAAGEPNAAGPVLSSLRTVVAA